MLTILTEDDAKALQRLSEQPRVPPRHPAERSGHAQRHCLLRDGSNPNSLHKLTFVVRNPLPVISGSLGEVVTGRLNRYARVVLDILAGFGGSIASFAMVMHGRGEVEVKGEVIGKSKNFFVSRPVSNILHRRESSYLSEVHRLSSGHSEVQSV